MVPDNLCQLFCSIIFCLLTNQSATSVVIQINSISVTVIIKTALFIVIPQRQVELFHQVQLQLKKERAENILLEVRLREEISREFMTLFSEMQGDFK